MTKPKPERAREGAPLPIPDPDLPPWTSICHQLPSPPQTHLLRFPLCTMAAQWSHSRHPPPNPALLDTFRRRDAGLSTPPSAQRGDANCPSVPRSGLAPHCAIGDACHWPDFRLAIVSFGAFCRKLGVLVGAGLNVIPAAGESSWPMAALMSLVRWIRWISGSRKLTQLRVSGDQDTSWRLH